MQNEVKSRLFKNILIRGILSAGIGKIDISELFELMSEPMSSVQVQKIKKNAFKLSKRVRSLAK